MVRGPATRAGWSHDHDTSRSPCRPAAGRPAQPPGGPRVTGDEIRDLGRLRRSATDRKVAGVAGGLARHLDIDPHHPAGGVRGAGLLRRRRPDPVRRLLAARPRGRPTSEAAVTPRRPQPHRRAGRRRRDRRARAGRRLVGRHLVPVAARDPGAGRAAGAVALGQGLELAGAPADLRPDQRGRPARARHRRAQTTGAVRRTPQPTAGPLR